MSDPIQKNKDYWNRSSAGYQDSHGASLEDEPMSWGVWRIPEAELQVLGEIQGRDVLELGCGGAQWAVALVENGARAVGIDLSPGHRLVRLTISPDANCRFPVDVTAQTRHVEGLQQYIYTPGEGRLVEALAGDDNCAVAVFEEIARPGATESIDWTFTVN